jgi:hypothetical protein
VGRLIAGLDHRHPALAIADQIDLECQAGGTALQHLEGPLDVVEPLAPADITPAQIDNFSGLQLAAAFYRDHPQFRGAPGQVEVLSNDSPRPWQQ